MRHFIKFFVTDGRLAAEKLRDEELAALIKMALHVRMRDNTVRRRDGAAMNQQDIAVLFGKSERQARRVLDSLKSRGVVEVVKEGQGYAYRVSDRLVYRGGGPYQKESSKVVDLARRRQRRASSEI